MIPAKELFNIIFHYEEKLNDYDISNLGEDIANDVGFYYNPSTWIKKEYEEKEVQRIKNLYEKEIKERQERAVLHFMKKR